MSLSQAHRSPTIEEQDVADFDGITAYFLASRPEGQAVLGDW